MNRLFFELIRVAVGNADCLSRTPNAKDWKNLYLAAEKQALVGVCFYGVQKLARQGQIEHLSIPLKMRWLTMSMQILQRNELMVRRCVEVQELLTKAGFKSTILKGQGNAALYVDASGVSHISEFLSGSSSLASYRQSGDIDVYVDASREEVIAFVKSLGDKKPDWDYKHVHLRVFDDTEVEVHYVPELMRNLFKNRKLQKWFAFHKDALVQREARVEERISTISSSVTIDSSSRFTMPSIEFNLFYVLLHAYRHFLSEGVGLRQMMDYYFVLRSVSSYSVSEVNATSLSRDGMREVFQEFGMMRFAKGVMWLMQEVFGLEEEYLLCEPDAKEGRYILAQIMEGGNFGQHDKRLKIRMKGKVGSVCKMLLHNIHLLVHYPQEAFWAPVWVVYHFVWKRALLMKDRCRWGSKD